MAKSLSNGIEVLKNSRVRIINESTNDFCITVQNGDALVKNLRSNLNE